MMNIPQTLKRRNYQVINYIYDWMSKDFDQIQWNAELSALARQAKIDVATHFEEGS